MTLFQFILIIAAFIFILFWLDLYKRKKVNLLHVIVFVLWWAWVLAFAIDINFLNKFGEFFGVARGADLLVYVWIILLFYFYVELLNKHTKDKYSLTRLVTQLAINECLNKEWEFIKNWKNKEEKDDYIFNIRVWNEEKTIGAVIDEVIHAGFNKIVIINDGSIDDTLDIVEKKREEYKDKMILVLSHNINRGGWAANQTWFQFVAKNADKLQVKRFVCYDSDGQMDIRDMKTFMEIIKNNEGKWIDLYLWSRFVRWAQTDNMPFMRRVILKIAKLVTFMFYGSKTTDPHNGYRVMTIDTLRKFKLTADGMHYANEINEQIRKHKMKFVEVPVYIRYTDYSLGKWQKNSNSLKLAAEMIYKKLFFK